MSGWGDAVRLSVGTFTAIRVPAPRTVDRGVAGRAMVLAPLVGLGLGAVAAVVLDAARWAYDDPRLSAALAVVVLALLTRGIHLDGLADTADALGAASRERGLAVMRVGDIGPFGVVTLVLVLLVQVLALGEAVVEGHGTQGVLTACVVGRLAATWGCARGIPAAREEGLGALVAGTVRRRAALLATVLVLAATAVYGGLVDDDHSGRLALLAVASVVVGLGCAAAVLVACLRRFRGITGDVLGAMLELATLGTLLVLAH